MLPAPRNRTLNSSIERTHYGVPPLWPLRSIVGQFEKEGTVLSKYLAWAALLMLGGLMGCASWQTPSADLAKQVPVIEIGNNKPEGNEYILFVPAGKDVPVKMTVGGSFLSQEGYAETSVKFRQDLYLYKYWSSFDGKTWERSHGLFETLLSAGLDPEGGKVEIKVNKTK